MLYDISPAIHDRMAVWPGDTRPRREVVLDLASGDMVTLSSLHATVHLGAHADAPSHYGLGAPSIDACPLELYLGPCQVVHVPVGRGKRVDVGLFGEAPRAPRVLIATGTASETAAFTEDFAWIDPALLEWLADQGVCLVGIDAPSIDPFDSAELPSHKTALAREIAILEGLDLHAVPDGLYELIALPLRLVGFDASPVRAVLRTLPG